MADIGEEFVWDRGKSLKHVVKRRWTNERDARGTLAVQPRTDAQCCTPMRPEVCDILIVYRTCNMLQCMFVETSRNCNLGVSAVL